MGQRAAHVGGHEAEDPFRRRGEAADPHLAVEEDGRDLGRLGYIPGGVDKFAAAVNTLLVKSRSSWP